jgi:uncharacterized membrane protein YfcA
MAAPWILWLIMPVIAFLYASVGHGGASSYLLLLNLLEYPPQEARTTALVLNIFVSLISFLSFRKAEDFPKPLFLALIATSIPASFLGGSLSVDPVIYRRILGGVLLIPALRLLGLFPVKEADPDRIRHGAAAAMGLAIGLISGLIGIGGGIILSPLLLLLGWTSLKQTAAISALFIFLNSIAGLMGSGMQAFDLPPGLISVLPVVLLGGFLGARLGAGHFNSKTLRYLLALVTMFGAIKLVIG